jgi:hypothetical protein
MSQNLDRLRVKYSQTVIVRVNEHTPPPRITVTFGAVTSAEIEAALTPYKAFSHHPAEDGILSGESHAHISVSKTSIPILELGQALAKDLEALGLNVTLEKATYKPSLEYVEVTL